MPSIISAPEHAQSPDVHADPDFSPRKGRDHRTFFRLIGAGMVATALMAGALFGASLQGTTSATLGHATTQHIVPLGECGGTPAPC